MDIPSVLSAYRRQAPIYDAVFGTLLGPGRAATVELANRLTGRKVLEVGVGTGLSLPRYRSDIRVTGIDISPDMLDIARRRVADKKIPNVDALYEMDAEALDFGDGSFDTVIAMYVASVVPHPDKLVAEMQRVCRPDGDILVVNHFAGTGGIRGNFERGIAPLSKKLGWRPDFEMEPFLRSGTMTVIDKRNAPPFGLFTILHCRNTRPMAQAAE